MTIAEYIWIDGTEPTARLRSKTRIIETQTAKTPASAYPSWSFDGSSTGQADGSSSDCLLRPVHVVPNPLHGCDAVLILCEVYDSQNAPHSSNSRAYLRAVMESGATYHAPWVGFEQEYTLFQKNRPLGWPEEGYPAAQGPYYCSVGADTAFGRDVAEAHMKACLEAGLMYYGLNAEVMPGQWEFQIGYRGFDAAEPSPLAMSDQLWIARWLLLRIAETHGVSVSFDNKPMAGDWNGAGMHTNFSTNATRNPETGMTSIKDAIERLESMHWAHVACYGEGLAARLTGLHETCSIEEFRSGNMDRGASVRIPVTVAEKGYGYFEDRRPGANADPYYVVGRLSQTVCGISSEGFSFAVAQQRSERRQAA